MRSDLIEDAARTLGDRSRWRMRRDGVMECTECRSRAGIGHEAACPWKRLDDAIRARCEAATRIVQRETKRSRYDHGGGRMCVEKGDERDLILDVYNEGDREFYFGALDDVKALLSHVARLEEALRFYADKSHWSRGPRTGLGVIFHGSPGVGEHGDRAEDDIDDDGFCGAKARSALGAAR